MDWRGRAELEVLTDGQVLSHEATYQVKMAGQENDLIERIRKERYFDPIHSQLDELLDPHTFVGRAPEQVDTFLRGWVEPALGDDELRAAVSNACRVELTV